MRVTACFAAFLLLAAPVSSLADACDDARALRARVAEAEREVGMLPEGPALGEYAGNPGAAMALERRRKADAARAELASRREALREAETRCARSGAPGAPAKDVPPPPAATHAPPVSPAPPAVLPGCGKDTDCKGDRICESGRCVDPVRRDR